MRIPTVLALLALAACTTGKHNVVQAPAAEKLAAYKGVVVQKVETAGWFSKNPRVRDNPAYSNWRSEIDIASDSVPAAAKKPLSEFYEVRNDAGENAFIIQLELREFDPGPADPLGGPNGKIAARVVLVDAATKQAVGEAEVSATISSGGTLANTYEECGRRAAQFVIDARPKKK